MNIVATRLLPGTDLFEGIQKFVQENDIRAGVLVSCHASLSRIRIRYPGVTADNLKFLEREANYDIASASGIVSTDGLHIHLVLVDSECAAIGGHVETGNIVRTTAEIAIAVETDLVFARGLDENTGFEELEVFGVVTPSGTTEA